MKKFDLDKWNSLLPTQRLAVLHALEKASDEYSSYTDAHPDMRAEVKAEFEEQITAFDVALDILKF